VVFTVALFGLAVGASCCHDFEMGVFGIFGSWAALSWFVLCYWTPGVTHYSFTGVPAVSALPQTFRLIS
jgi:hypothetical protein